MAAPPPTGGIDRRLIGVLKVVRIFQSTTTNMNGREK